MGCCQGCARWIIGIISACVLICAVVAAVYVYAKEKDDDWLKTFHSGSFYFAKKHDHRQPYLKVN